MENIRNITIAAHVDAGKTTLTDAFAARSGLISGDDAGKKCFADNRADEQERGITIKSTGISMNMEFDGQTYAINLLDSPGHVDFNSETISALRITDGSVIVVDCIEGVCVQTEMVLRQSLAEQVKPILYFNKLDRYIFELQIAPEEAYQRINGILDHVNSLISTYKSENSQLKLDLSPEMGNVFFGSAKFGWGFGLHTIARIMAKKMNCDEKIMMKKLWGEYYFDPDTKKITTESMKDGKPLERTFCKYVLGPIFALVQSLMKGDSIVYERILAGFDVKLSEKDKKLTPGREFYEKMMRKTIPIADALLYGIVYKLPSPKTAQKYRVTTLYDGPLDDECAMAIANCDPNGPLSIYITKMIPMDDGSRFYAFGRVFSGTVSTGQKVRILGANYKHGEKTDLYENKAIQRVCKMVGGKAETCDFRQCGNTVALVGIDNYILKTGTITSSMDSYPIKTIKFAVSPVVRVSVSCKNSSDIPKLIEGLKKLSKADPCVQVIMTDTEWIVCGVGELHIEISIHDLRQFVKSEIVVSEPVVPLRETVLGISDQICLAKSPNKHNRLYMTAEAIDGELVQRMTDKEITSKMDINSRAKILVGDYNWNDSDAKKIWYFGPEGQEETNLMVDVTKGAQYMNEIKDHVKAGFEKTVQCGVLCEEPLRGVRFNLHDTTLHADAIHRGAGQIAPATWRCLYASMLTAKPAIMEPIFLAEIQVPDNYISTIYSCLSQKRGRVISQEKSIGNLSVIKGYLPVLESFGFSTFIREKTSGQALPQLVVDHWEIIQGDPLDPESKVGKIVREVRKRKGLKQDIPMLSEYLDKL